MEFFFTKGQKKVISYAVRKCGADAVKVRQELENFSDVSLEGDEYEMLEDAVRDIFAVIQDVPDDVFTAYLINFENKEVG